MMYSITNSLFMLALNISSTILEAFCGSRNMFTPSLLSSHSCIHDFLSNHDNFASIDLQIA